MAKRTRRTRTIDTPQTHTDHCRACGGVLTDLDVSIIAGRPTLCTVVVHCPHCDAPDVMLNRPLTDVAAAVGCIERRPITRLTTAPAERWRQDCPACSGVVTDEDIHLAPVPDADDRVNVTLTCPHCGYTDTKRYVATVGGTFAPIDQATITEPSHGGHHHAASQ